ncbi:trigger factor [Candidatus Liberibacter americanus]|uniref:Trigger factor n=1 Tax=Candidatus Liberibacter americanus str. Sao Paulo TaxID=1261131 RepID=U6B5E4_9HYPH|nr:trigger factor [Candidatus Liberibacter americanus]AHA27888.1 FKBP-type peptidyl-prolyl cis-trans isomerase [Candidatus Liberibacter americanus str. Sao Paulo]
MQVIENVSDGLKRELDIILSSDQLIDSFNERLEDIKSKANIKGFRPGKVPLSHIKSMYGKSILSEIVDETIKEKVPDILSKRNDRAAMQPNIVINDGQEDVLSLLLQGSVDLKLSLSYEVMPEIEIQPFDDLVITREICDIDQSEINKHALEIAENNRSFEVKDGVSSVGDRITIDYNIAVDDMVLKDHSKENFQFILGSDDIFSISTDSFVGTKVGDSKKIDFSFPDDYYVESLAGKNAIFSFSIKKIEFADPAVVNDDLAIRLGLESESKMIEMVSKQLNHRIEMISRQKIKRQILDYLDNKYQFDVPESLVNAEYNSILQHVKSEISASGQNIEDNDVLKEEDLRDYKILANRRVRSGIVLGTIGSKQSIQVTDDEMKSAISQHLRRFPGREKQMIEYFQKNSSAIDSIRAPIFEEKVIDYFISEVKIVDNKLSMKQFLSNPHGISDYFSQDEDSNKSS